MPLARSARIGSTSAARAEAMAIRALLLDFDGTLADSLPALRHVYERFVSSLGGRPSSGEFDALNGPPLREVVEALCVTHQGRAHSNQDLEQYHHLIVDELTHIEPAPGARELLDAARYRGVRCAIVTSGRTELVQSWLEGANLQIDLIVSGDDVAEGKPSPAPYRLALQRLGVEPEEALAIEDSEFGVRSAITAGIRTLSLSSVQTPGATCIESLASAIEYLGP